MTQSCLNCIKNEDCDKAQHVENYEIQSDCAGFISNLVKEKVKDLLSYEDYKKFMISFTDNKVAELVKNIESVDDLHLRLDVIHLYQDYNLRLLAEEFKD